MGFISAFKAAAKDLLEEGKAGARESALEIRNAFRQLTSLQQLQEAGTDISTRITKPSNKKKAVESSESDELAVAQQGTSSRARSPDRPENLPRRRRGSWLIGGPLERLQRTEWRGSRVLELQDQQPITTERKNMDPAQTKNRNALHGILAMLKGAQGPAQAAKIVSLALKTESLYTFQEIRNTSQVKALEGTDQAGWLEVLQIFQFGTYRDYAKKEATLSGVGITLDQKQRHKLRVKTFIILGSQPPITFKSACSALAIKAESKEDELIDMARYFMAAVDEGLVNGRIDSLSRKIHIDEIAPLRDVSLTEYVGMLNSVNSWMEKTDDVLTDMDNRIRDVKLSAERRRTEEEEFEARKDAADVEISKGKKRGAGSSGDGTDEYAGGGAPGSRNTRQK